MSGCGRRNILLVIFDSLGEGALASMADALPVLSGLRREALRFAAAYAPSPEGGPARASLFTGLDIPVHGVWTDGVALPERETTVAQRLAACGWRTWLVGRRHLAGVSNWTTEHARPFEYAHLDWAHGPLHRSRQNAYLAWLQDRAPAAYAEIFPTQANADDTDCPDWQRAAMSALPDALSFNRWVGARSCELLASHGRDGPFFGIAGFVIGETMGAAPRQSSPCEALQERALRQADAALGDILRQLERSGLAETTALVVTAARGSVAEADTDAPMQESAIRVPLMIRSPGLAAGTVAQAVSTIDVAATLYALSRVPPPRRLQGAPLLATGPGSVGRGWALSRLRRDHGWKTALRHGRWKLVVSHGDPDAGVQPGFSLFDLREDPEESRDLAADQAHQGMLETMIDLMIDARVAMEDRTEPRIASF